jgi:transposase
MVVKAIRGGLPQTATAKLFGVSVRAANKWMAATKEGGLRALNAKPRGRPAGAGALTPAQAMKVRRRIVDAMPDQLKLPFDLWTRAAVAALIARECEVTVSLTTVGRYLAAWGFSVQQPVRRAYERNDAAIAYWLQREYPAMARDGPTRCLQHDLRDHQPGAARLSGVSRDLPRADVRRLHAPPPAASGRQGLPHRGWASGVSFARREGLCGRPRRRSPLDPTPEVLPGTQSR